MQSSGGPGRLFDFPEIPNKDDVVDWTYSKRRDMQEIVPRIYLGPYSAAMKSKFDNLKAHSITHIVCIRQDIEANFVKPNFKNDFKYLILDVADLPTENIIKHFPQVKAFIDEGLSSAGNVLLHGNAGISRSAALMIAYIMETYGLSYRDAFQHVQQKRFCINPNEGFAHQLMEYEPIYLANYQARQQQIDCQAIDRRNGIKRPFEDEIDGDDGMD
ncbi:serine/threonine/tyrosine-interacting protein-like isoform X2 [Actinia tenebrosa]|uniref:Serine/threonine/tyrosine-interacting protein-like isoform X2 n=1 Tax=Actinia tenebrosa TaxID=6105 RepID=A0A6P8IQ90_ACTTE|nr:serine/threonine/tyrosine-interacting protein-like isoform X2 [Actinia tenebrosa]